MSVTLTGLAVSFAALWLVFRSLELLRPEERRLPILRRGLLADAAYWVFTPVVTKAMTRISLALVLVPLAYVIHGKVDLALAMGGFGPASRLPYAVQAIAMLLIGDFLGYFMHRWFHGRRMWRFHAVHHSSVDLDWLSSVRLHPVNDALMRLATVVPLVALGFAPVVLAGVVPLLSVMAILVHANVDWDWGPLRAVIASPRFHRWHHADEADARDKNFAGLFPVFDIAFGTYYMPRDRVPGSFGTQTSVPQGLLGQLAFPFRRP